MINQSLKVDFFHVNQRTVQRMGLTPDLTLVLNEIQNRGSAISWTEVGRALHHVVVPITHIDHGFWVIERRGWGDKTLVVAAANDGQFTEGCRIKVVELGDETGEEFRETLIRELRVGLLDLDQAEGMLAAEEIAADLLENDPFGEVRPT